MVELPPSTFSLPLMLAAMRLLPTRIVSSPCLPVDDDVLAGADGEHLDLVVAGGAGEVDVLHAGEVDARLAAAELDLVGGQGVIGFG
jgi:hypothetical protein